MGPVGGTNLIGSTGCMQLMNVILASRAASMRFGLRHRAAVGITERTDAIALVVSEETGSISYINDGEFVPFKDLSDLANKIKADIL